MKKLVIFDGNSIMNRAYYGVRPLTNKEGLYTHAIFGYLNILKKHLDAIQPEYAAVAFDLKAPTFRHLAYPDYKATRKAMPEELQVQVPYVWEVTALLGIHCLMKEGYEADDILGTVANDAEKHGIFSYVVTGDKDSLQLVSDHTTVIIASLKGDEENTPETIREKFGLVPGQLIEVKALAGDPSDNIPGVFGIGEKTAVKLIAETGTVDGLYQNLDSLTLSDGVKNKLKNGEENARISRHLATICLNVPDIPPAETLLLTEMKTDKLRKLFIKLEFVRLMSRFGLDVPDNAITPAAIAEISDGTMEKMEKSEDSHGQLTFGDMDPPPEDLPTLQTGRAENILPLTQEPCFLIVNNGVVCVRYQGKSVSLPDTGTTFLKHAKNLVVFNAKEYFHYAKSVLGEFPPEEQVIFDAFLAAYIINPADNANDINRISIRFLSRMLTPAQSENPCVALEVLESLYPILKKDIEKLDAKKLYDDIDLPLAYTLAKMEDVGFKVSKEGLEAYGVVLKENMSSLEEEIYALAGYVFNINSPKQLGVLLFEKMGLPFAKKNSRGFSTDAETLEKLRPYTPIVDLVLRYRQAAKLYGTYIEGLLKEISPKDGRIHSTFNQMLTQTGRLSSNEPNLQNIPVRTNLGRELRRFFVAENEEYTLVDADYSQIELRILAHVANDDALLHAFHNHQDIHTTTASQIFHVSPDQVTPEMRKYAKAVNFGIVYGISSFSLAIDIGTSRAEAAAYIERYFGTYPNVKIYLKNVVEQGAKNGYVTTIFNRRRYIPELSATNKNTRAFGERIAMNTPIQGSAADIIKLAMVNVDRRLAKEHKKSRLILQVHDELIIEAHQSEADTIKALLKEEMEKAVALSVLLQADVNIGKTWYDAK